MCRYAQKVPEQAEKLRAELKKAEAVAGTFGLTAVPRQLAGLLGEEVAAAEAALAAVQAKKKEVRKNSGRGSAGLLPPSRSCFPLI